MFCLWLQGSFSHSLAEYTLAACNWFAKDFPRLRAQQKARKWAPFNVEELKNKTMGVVGYGDIGQAAARIARAFGMKIIALRRNPQLSEREMLEHLTVSSALACSASRGALSRNTNLASVWLLACRCQCLLHWLTPPTSQHTSASHSL